MMKRITSLFLLAILLMSICSVSSARAVQPRYAYVHSISADIFRSGSTITCNGSGQAMKDDLSVLVCVQLLRKPVNSGLWYYVDSWNATGTGIFGAGLERYVTVPSGNYYKVHVNVTIFDAQGNQLEIVGLDSHTIFYPAPN